MNISEMHVSFRQYAQQMGMQNVRAILPEQIDLVLNSSISDTINQIITQNIGNTNDRIITDNSKIGQINALRSLYKVELVNAVPISVGTTDAQHPFETNQTDLVKKISAQIINFKPIYPSSTVGGFDYLFLVDLSINYTTHVGEGETAKTTNYFPVRLIDDAFLADTLNDFILKPRPRSPIAVVYNDTIDVYLGEQSGGNIELGLSTKELRVSYIAKPAKVQYKSDLGGDDISCDLPDYLHEDIVRRAVNLYRQALVGSISTAQGQQQVQQQEDTRNNANPYTTQQQ